MASAHKLGPGTETKWTDEGIPHTIALDATSNVAVVTNIAVAKPDQRLPLIHVNGLPFVHVGEDSSGNWIYRYDK